MNSAVDIVLSNILVATALAVVIFGFTLSVRRSALTHCLWVIVLLKSVTPPLIPICVPIYVDASAETRANDPRTLMERWPD